MSIIKREEQINCLFLQGWQLVTFKEEKMKTHLRVFAIVMTILALGCVTVSAYSSANTQTVIINLDSVPRMVSTEAETVGVLLEELESTIDTKYVLEDAKEADSITDMMNLSLISVTEKTTSTTQSSPFETIKNSTTDLAEGETRVIQKGVDGQISTIEKEIFHGESFVTKELIETKILSEPINEIIEYGTASVIDGMTYTKSIPMKVTAYTPFDPGCNGITATGTVAKKGVVAVDPSVIPLGTRVYVPGYGVAIAEDVGGAIKGSRLDVCIESTGEAMQWGVKNIPVYILK